MRVLCGYFEHPRRVQFEGYVAVPLQTITILLGSKRSLLSFRSVLQDALSVMKVSPPVQLKVVRGRNKQLPGAEEVSKAMREVEEGSEAVDPGRRKGRAR